MNQHFDVIVVGGGIVGLTAALAMAQRQYTVAVIDAGSLKADTSVPDLRVYAINHASKTLLQQLEVWQFLEFTRVSPYSHMHVQDGVNGAWIEFDARQIAAPNLGSIIEESVLKAALLNQISTQPRISLFPDCKVDTIQTDEQQVTVFSQDTIWDGQLLMIADGANSPLRQLLNVELNTWSYNQKAIIASVMTEHPHQQTAWQVFNTNGPLAFLPLSQSNHCSIVWSTDSTHAQELMDRDEDAFNEALTHAFSKLGQVKITSKRHQFPLHMRHVKQYTGKRWMILGDAAHTIHPLAGLGLNVGLADVSSWINCLDTMKGGHFTAKQLGAWQRERKHAVWQIILLMEGFKRLFSQSIAPITVLRGLGLNFCNEFTPLKRLFIQHAAGLKGENYEF